MSFTGNENHDIPLATAAQWTKNYRDVNPSTAIIAHYFGKQAISQVLAQTNCVGIRSYYAINADGVKELIIVGVDANGNDLYEGMILDRSFKCPQACSTSNPLNS